MAQRWTFEEDYIVYQFCCEQEYMDIERELLQRLINKLKEAGFEERSSPAVYKRARDFTFLLRGWDAPYASTQVRMVYQMLLSNNNDELYKSIKSYILEVYNPDAPTDSDSESCNLLNMFEESDNLMHLVHTIKYETTFPMVLQKYVELKGVKKHNVMCKRIGMKPDTFSAILRGKYPVVKKENILRLCIGLELNIDQAQELLNSAGYILSDAIITDVVIKAFLWNRCYYPGAVNMELIENNAPILFENLKM